jgi:pyruvate,orthophosphate dikinase
MEAEGLIDRKTAILRVDPDQLEQQLHQKLDPSASYDALTTGLPASPGAAVGRVVFTAEDAVDWSEDNDEEKHRTILVREETSPEDIDGMNASQGFLTARGGMTSHAAVVARGMGKCCVAGAGHIKIDYASRTFSVKGTTVKEGDWLTLDGSWASARPRTRPRTRRAPGHSAPRASASAAPSTCSSERNASSTSAR